MVTKRKTRKYTKKSTCKRVRSCKVRRRVKGAWGESILTKTPLSAERRAERMETRRERLINLDDAKKAASERRIAIYQQKAKENLARAEARKTASEARQWHPLRRAASKGASAAKFILQPRKAPRIRSRKRRVSMF